MNVQDLDPQFAEDIRARYRALDVREEELKREIKIAQQRLDGVRELKKQIAQQVFQQEVVNPATGTVALPGI